jgi:hypothetical protein
MKPTRITPRHTDTGFRLDVTVVNASDPPQPVYDARLYWYSRGEPYGRDNPEPLGTVLGTETRFRDFMSGSVEDACGAILTFRDTARVSWIRTADGGLMTGDADLAPDIARALFRPSGNGASRPQTLPDVEL